MGPLGGRLHPSKAAHPLSWARLPYPVSPSFTGCCYCFPKLLADRSEQCRRDIRSSNTGRVAVSAVSPPPTQGSLLPLSLTWPSSQGRQTPEPGWGSFSWALSPYTRNLWVKPHLLETPRGHPPRAPIQL